MGQRIQAAREGWARMGWISRVLTVVVAAFDVSLWLGAGLFCLGVLLVALTAGAYFSLVILGLGVLLLAFGGLLRYL